MRIIHLSDLHLGKRVNEIPMDDDQKYILDQILSIIKKEKADAVIIAGDVYDRSIPPEKAVATFDWFLTELLKAKVPTLVISGNHDSAERISFANKIMEASNIYVSTVYDGNVKKVTLKDEYGPVNFYLLPFIKPCDVNCYYEDEKIKDYTDAMRVAISHMDINKKERNILVAHQFVTGATVTKDGSEENINVGGLDNINASVFDDFDYVALGHIHGRQNIGGDPRICYCGTPLKYSFAECKHKKGVKVIDLLEKTKEGNETNCEHKYVDLKPLHEMREIKGKFDVLMAKETYEGTDLEDYIHVTLTDEDDIINGRAKLQSVYKNLMKLDYDNSRTRNFEDKELGNTKGLTPNELASQFFEKRIGRAMNEEETKYMSLLIEQIWEGKEEE